MKKLLLVLFMLTCIFTLSAFSSAADNADDVDESTIDGIKQEAAAIFKYFYDSDDETLAVYLQRAKDANETTLIDAFDSWMSVKGELGKYISTDGVEFTKADNGYKVTVSATFEQRTMTFSINLDKELTSFENFQFDPQYTIGEKIQKADFNTLLIIGTVLIVLIFITIGGFKYMKNSQIQNQKLVEQDAPGSILQANTEVSESENLADDLELVAVITAAIAAASNIPADGLIVRSIKRARTSNWKRA